MITEPDLFVPSLNFVFGEADSTDRVAIISLVRLREESYGLSKDEMLFRERIQKEAIHELGHTFGLGHCNNKRCVMHFSNCLADTDYKRDDFAISAEINCELLKVFGSSNRKMEEFIGLLKTYQVESLIDVRVERGGERGRCT